MCDLTNVSTYVHSNFYFKLLHTSLMMAGKSETQLAYSTQKYTVVLDSELPNYLLLTSNVCTTTILQFLIKQSLNEDSSPLGF